MPCTDDDYPGTTCVNRPITKLNVQEVIIVADERGVVSNLWVTIEQTILLMDDKDALLQNR